MTLAEIEREVGRQHGIFVDEDRRPRRGIYNVICRPNGNGRGWNTIGGSARLPEEYGEHPERLRELVVDHNGQWVIRFFGNNQAARERDFRYVSNIPLRDLGKIELT